MAKSGASTGRREATTSAILRATGDLIAERGIDGFTLSEVSRRAGINRALIYHYFQNRDNLIVSAINDILERNKQAPSEPNADAVEDSLRVHIAHPEVSRVFFQLLLARSPSLPLGNRLTDSIESIDRYHREANIDIPYDLTFLLIMLVLAQFSWPLSREAISKTLDIGVEEADERFIAAARWATDMALSPVQPSAN